MRLWPVVVGLAMAGCTMPFWIEDGAIADGGHWPKLSDGGLAWGAFAASLAVPECPPSPELTVNTTADEFDGDTSLRDPEQAGPTLSLTEALWIAFNRPGPDQIRFAPEVFPVDAPATIAFEAKRVFPQELTFTCIDARRRGVVVDWAPGDENFRQLWSLGEGSLQVGLTMLHLPSKQTTSGTIAGCRVNTDGTGGAGSTVFSLSAHGTGVVGPGNVVVGGVWLGGPATMRGNSVNYDPLTRTSLGSSSAVRCDGRDCLVEDNVFSSVVWFSLFEAGGVVVRNNLLGLGRDGLPLPGRGSGIVVSSYGSGATAVVGPGNTITGSPMGIEIIGPGAVRITQNRIFGNAAGISYSAAPPVAPPSIEAADVTGVRGVCPSAAGHVELFWDASDQGEKFLGEADCTAGGTWAVAAVAPAGGNVTATLTDASGRTSRFSPPLPVP